MNQKSLYMVILTKLDSFISCVFQVHGIRYVRVSPAHSVKIIIDKSECICINGGYHVDASAL